MPELPDVENYRRYLEAHGLHQRIAHVEIDSEKILRDTPKTALCETLLGRELIRTHRHGKHLFAALDDGPWLMLHFGMTGYLAYFEAPDDDPKHDRLRLDFANGWRLAFVNQRLFGEAGIVDDPATFAADRELGPDALGLDAHAFTELLSHRRGQIKAALMDQSLIAGIGNVYSDEMLYQAGIHPKAQVDDLDAATVQTLHETMMRVLQIATAKGAGSDALIDRLPADWLLPRRKQGAKCPRCGGEIANITAASRQAYLCPQCQSLHAP